MVKMGDAYRLKAMKNTPQGAPRGKGASSPRRASIIVPRDVLVEELASIGFLDAAMHSELRFDVGKRPFQGIICIGYSQVRMVIEGPQIGHVALQAQVCAS